MPEPGSRVTDLSPAKQRLLQQLLDARTGRPARAASVSSMPAAILAHAGAHEADAKTACRRFYDTITEQLNASEFGSFSFFLNYGYVANLNPQHACVRLPEAMLNRNSVQLVLELLEDCVTAGSRVLDIGCGRGGTVSVINQFFPTGRVTGLDISAAAIAFAHATHRRNGTSFLQGDAERLPFAAGSFDVVTNLESSSCYPDLQAFYAETHRVLADGGRFLYSDCLPAERFPDSIGYLTGLGFAVERDRDITSNVLASCEQIARSRVGAYSAGNDAGVMNDFLGAPGSQFYEAMRARRWTYRIYKLRKTGA
jgi:phthiocerol/phenolphthiocerol synthesis type-I polyketide synthase E